MESFRLDSISPTVANHFRQARPDARRRATRIACEHSAAAVGLSGADVEHALQILREAMSAEQALRSRLERKATEFDEEYFRLDEEGAPGTKDEALQAFSKARATSALAFALADEDASLHEAIYEALSALSDPAPLLGLLEETLT